MRKLRTALFPEFPVMFNLDAVFRDPEHFYVERSERRKNLANAVLVCVVVGEGDSRSPLI